MIFIGWIGEGAESDALLEDLARHTAREFDTAPARWRPDGRPHEALDQVRGQHSSRMVLAWISQRLPAPDAKVLAITDVDLFLPVLTFVFGEAQLGGAAAVVSSARLEGWPRRIVAARLRKEAVHELGHTFGLVHCGVPRCVMSRAASIAAVDAKDERLCDDCRIRYRERVRERIYVETSRPNPDRR